MAAMRCYAIALLLTAPILLASGASADFSSPLQVELTMPQYPSVGNEGTLDCVIQSRYTLDNVSLTISLSDGVALTKGSAVWQGSIAASRKISLPLTVKVTTEGNKTIRATVFCRVDDDTAFSDVAQVFFNSGVARSAIGHVTDYVTTETEAASLETGEISLPTKLVDAARRPAEAVVEPEPCTAGPDNRQTVESGPPVEGMLTVTGRWCYYDRDDTYKPMEWVFVELRRGDTDAVLTSTWVTDNNGQYTFPAITNPGTAGFRVRAWCFHNNTYSSDSKALRVVDVGAGRDDGGNVYTICYSIQTAVRTSADGTYDMGTWHVNNGSTNEPAWWIMMDLNKGFWWPYWWNDHNTMNGGVTVEWSSTSTHGNHNHRTDDGGNIHLTAEAPEVCDVVIHEYGHEVQWDGYGQWLPSSDCPSPHYFELIGGSHCAWYEGFANWYKFAVTNDPVYHWAGGGTLNCETPTWGTAGWDNGDLVEGRTAGALWDFGDSNADGYDTCQLDWEYIWDTWYGSANRDNTFSEFWTRWKNKGNPKHHPMKSLYQNTIDYNTAPTFSGLPNRSTNEDTPYNNAIDLWLYAYDPDSYDSELEYTIIGNTNPNCGVSIDVGGYVDINPVLNWNGTSTVTIRCSDGIVTASDSFVVTVNPVNDPPSITGLPNRTTNEDTPYSNAIDLWAYTYDPETADSGLTFTITGNTNSGCGVSVGSNRYININPTLNWNGYSDVTVRATDPSGLWGEDTFRITVNPVNDPPVITGLPDRYMNEDAHWDNAIDLWPHTTDPETVDDDLVFTITQNTNTNCGVSIDSGRYVDINPTENWYGSSTVTIRATDPQGLWGEDTFIITVYSINDPPTISGIPDKLVATNASNNDALDLWVYADDIETSDGNLTYTITANTSPDCGVSIDPDDYVNINPTPGWTGYSEVTVRVTDPGGLWAEDTFRIVVATPFDKISQARANSNGTWVSVSNKISTAKFADLYYIEEANRSSGIRVASASGPEPGRYVTVAGPLSTSYAERVITPYYTNIGTTSPEIALLSMNNDSLGGAGPDVNTPSVPENGSGAYNVGLLVRTTGRVIQHTSGGRFYITDGGSVQDNASGAASVFVYSLPSGYRPPVGSYVSVTGISSASTLGGKPLRVLRPRTDSDIQVRSLSAAIVCDTAPADARSFKSLLDADSVHTTMIPLSDVTTADLAQYQVILIGNDTGSWADPAKVAAVLAPGTPVIAIGQGGGYFLDAVTSPDLFIGWGHSAWGSNETHAYVKGGDIYSYPYAIPYSPGQNIYLYYTPGVNAATLWDPTNTVPHFLDDFHYQGYAPVCVEQNRFYQWGFSGAPTKMTVWGQKLFVNLVFRTARY